MARATTGVALVDFPANIRFKLLLSNNIETTAFTIIMVTIDIIKTSGSIFASSLGCKWIIN